MMGELVTVSICDRDAATEFGKETISKNQTEDISINICI